MSIAQLQPPSFFVRAYRDADASATLALFIAAVMQTAAADYEPEQLQAWARPDVRDQGEWNKARKARNTFVVAVAESGVGRSDVATEGYIDMLFVDPGHCGKGVGSLLLVEAERLARNAGAHELYANVSITARPVFERSGFVVERTQHPVLAGVALTNFKLRKVLG